LFGSLDSVVPTLDEVRISIQYAQFQAIRKDTADEVHNHARYLFQIARKAPGSNSFEKYKSIFKTPEGPPLSIEEKIKVQFLLSTILIYQ
jgi:hypothetical protein